MKYASLFFIFLCFFYSSSWAQYSLNQNKIWAFGYYAGLDFTGGAPVAIRTSLTSSTIDVIEGCASVCDRSGNLLFYCTGDSIWNKTGVSMPNGTNNIPAYAHAQETFPGSYSCTQGTTIVPVLGNSNQYYVFTLEQEQVLPAAFAWTRLWYCVVDMTLAGGLGDVVPGRKYIPLDSNLSEKMLAIPGNNCDIWLLVHAQTTVQYKAYHITSAGIDPVPVISGTGSYTGPSANLRGVFKASPDRTKLICANYDLIYGEKAEYSNFDPATGIVSGTQVITNTSMSYGATFSPDNTKLYIYNYIGGTLKQYNITLPTIATIIASAVNIATGKTYVSDLKLGPDGKIYMNSLTNAPTVDVINFPNLTGAACNYVPNAIALLAGTRASLGMPNDYVVPIPGDTTLTHTDTVVCIPPGDSVVLASPAGASYYWFDGTTTRTHAVTTTGNYWVAYINGCDYTVDTFKLTQLPPGTTTTKHDTAICTLSSSVTLSGHAGYPTYIWSTGATGPDIVVSAAGTYWVHASTTCGSNALDTFVVTNITPDTARSRSDTSVCDTIHNIILTAPAGFISYLWNDGTTSNTVSVTGSGIYWVYAVSGCNIKIDSTRIHPIDPGTKYSNTLSDFCFPGNVMLKAPVGYPAYLWQDGTTENSYVATEEGVYWVSSTTSCSNQIDTFTIIPKNIDFSLGPDTSVCTAYKLQLSIPGATYLWQNGSTSNYVYVDAPGAYYVTAFDSGCVASDTINVAYLDLRQNIPDTFICKNIPFALQLYANVPLGGTALWSTGSTLPAITVTDSGSYWVLVSKNGCVALDTINVVTGYCDCWFSMPSAFTPNGDGLNDLCRPSIQSGCTASGYQFNIYNRWGQLVFTSSVRGQGWDGTFNGEPAEMGVYMYAIQYFGGVDSKPHYKTGDITLIR